MSDENRDGRACRARIRRTVAGGKDLVLRVELRMEETDRMLWRCGLTRGQVGR